jgi:lysophospholipase L1-like esterase
MGAWTARLLGVLLGVCLTGVLLEGGYRVYQAVVYGTSVWYAVDDLGRDPAAEDRLNPIAIDPRLGWRSASNYRFDGPRRNVDGSVYTVHVSFRPDGFRVFGDPSAREPRVLVVGDSYTQAVQVSDDDTYYALLGRALGAQMFVYGAGGFGTLQENLILDQYFEAIQPDLIVWQFCSNDFINNAFELEQASVLNNNHLVRPYLEDGRIVYALPTPDPLGLRTFWGLKSRVAYALLTRWDAFESEARAAGSVEHAIERLGFEHPGFRRSIDTTDRLLGMLRERVGATPVVAFNCDAAEPYTTAFQMISARHGIDFWPDVARGVDLAQGRGSVVRASDYHWNPLGHRVVAEALEARVRAALTTRAGEQGAAWPP